MSWLILLSAFCKSSAQIDIPCLGCHMSTGQFKILRADSAGSYFANRDTSKILYIANRTIYKLFDNKMQILVEGNLGGRVFTDYFKRFGKWTEYYQNGKIKAIGHYYEDEPLGLWQYFYENGNVKEAFNISHFQYNELKDYCRSGLYQSYYETGQLKIDGFYKAVLDSTNVELLDPLTGTTVIEKRLVLKSKEIGIWSYYSPDGKIEKTREYE